MIRPHRSADYEQLAELRWLLKADGDSHTDDTQKSEFFGKYLQQLQMSDELGDTIHWVIDDDARLVGVTTIRVVRKELSPVKEPSTWGYLTNTFVRADWRGRGHGTQLLKRAINWAGEQGLELLLVWPSEASYQYYRRAGFSGESDPLELVLTSD